MNPERRSIFALPAGRRAKWVVFLVWLVGIFIAAGPANLPGKFADAENNESTSYLPGDAESTKALAATEDLQSGELAPAVIVYRRESGLTPADRRKIVADVRRLTRSASRAWCRMGRRPLRAVRRSRRAPARRAASRSGCGGPTTPMPGQPAGYRPFVGPDLLAGRQGGDRDRLPEGRRPGRQDPRPDRRLARQGVRPGRRSRGEDHGRRRLRGRRHQGLRGHQRHAAAGRADAGDRPADPDLPLADLPVHPAGGGHVRGDPVPLDRLRHLRAGRDDQRAVELDHVDPRARRGHGLRAPGRGEIQGGAAPAPRIATRPCGRRCAPPARRCSPRPPP